MSVTCLVDLLRPSVGFAAVKLLEEAGCSVEAPRPQTCCGQPAYNSGDRATARAIAARTRFSKDRLPRTVDTITGPSRTGDIEPTIELRAHGPRSLHILVVRE